MSAHTPGPWVVDPRWGGYVRGGPFVGYVRGSAQDQIAMVTGSDRIDVGERDANTRLIAAAPDMLEALKALRNAMGMHGPCRQHDCSDCRRAFDACSAALAKATGVKP